MKFECDLIRDLMPLCADDAASESSKKAVQSHIAVCTECAREWDSIRGELTVSADAPPPDQKYASAAKKYRRSRGLHIMLCFFVMIVLIVGWWVSPLFDGHFTPLGAARGAMRSIYRNWVSGLPDYEIVYQYNWKTQDAVSYWVMPQNGPYLRVIKVERGKWNLYFERSGIYGSYDPEQGVVLLDFASTNASTNEWNEAVIMGVYAKDLAVSSIRMTVNGQMLTGTVSEQRFCALTFDPCEPGADYAPSGEALDAYGDVLYTLEQKRDKYNNRYYEWIPVP